MSKVFTAEYDAAENVFRLEERPEGVADRERVTLAFVPAERKRSFLDLRGCLAGEAGDLLAKAVEEMFPPWE